MHTDPFDFRPVFAFLMSRMHSCVARSNYLAFARMSEAFKAECNYRLRKTSRGVAAG